MKQNIGSTDRLFRLFLGIALLCVAFWQKSGLMAIFGLLSLYEAVASWCVFYQLLGRNTCPVKKENNTIPLLNIFLTGVAILIGAIILNIIAGYFGLYTWYDLIGNSEEVLRKSGLDNLLFLFIVYPFTLGYLSTVVKKILQ